MFAVKRIFINFAIFFPLVYLNSCGLNPSGKTKKPKQDDLALTAEKSMGRLRGYEAVNALLQRRFLNSEQSDFQIGTYLEFDKKRSSIFEFNKPSLVGLLGAYEGKGLKQEFVGGSPNAFNMLLWYVVLGYFASDVATTCGHTKPIQKLSLNKTLRLSVEWFCSAHKEPSLDKTQLRKFWSTMLVHDAPESSYEEWQEFILNRHAAKIKGAAFIKEAVLSALYQPYFLGQH